MTPGRKKTTPARGRSGEISVYQLKVTLQGIKPAIWRRIQVPGHIKLGVFHEILQEVMGWTNTHLHQFVIQGKHFGAPHKESDSPATEDENKLTLAEAIHLAGAIFSYEYDFGDGWEHQLKVENVLPVEGNNLFPACLAGTRACPPEDCGGPYGYQELLEALREPHHERHEELAEWLSEFSEGEGFDPERFNLTWINQALRAMAKRRSPRPRIV